MFSLFGGSPVVKRKSVRRKATKRKATKRKATKSKATRRKSVRRKATRRKAQKKRVAKGRKRFVYGGSPEGNEDKITELKQKKAELAVKLALQRKKQRDVLIPKAKDAHSKLQYALRNNTNESLSDLDDKDRLAQMQLRFSKGRIGATEDSIKSLKDKINRLENPDDDDYDEDVF